MIRTVLWRKKKHCCTHRERTTGSSSDEVFSICGLAVDPWAAAEPVQGIRVLVCVLLPSSSLAKGALTLCCWLDVWEHAWALLWNPHVLCALENLAAEMLEVSEVPSVSPGFGLYSTMLSGLTGVCTLGQRWKEGLLKWEGEVKPEVRSDCRWLPDGSKVSIWGAKKDTMC